MNSLGICISVYDKISELRLLLEILKQFDFVKRIVVVKNDKVQLEKLSEFGINEIIDKLIINEEFEFVSNPSTVGGHVSITCRIWESQRLGLLEASSGTDYVMHTHSDGWPLSAEKLWELLDEVARKGVDVAFRGAGFGTRTLHGEPLGKIDDHFYIVRSETIKKSSFLRRNALLYMPDIVNIHGLLAIWIMTEIGLDRSWHFDNGKEWLDWEKEKINPALIPIVRPLVFSENYAMLHCHREDFPDNYGTILQAKFLKDYNLHQSSEFIQETVSSLETEFPNALSKLTNHKERLHRRMTFLGYDVTQYRKNITLMEKHLASKAGIFHIINSLKLKAISFFKKRIIKKEIIKSNSFAPLMLWEGYSQHLSKTFMRHINALRNNSDL